MGFCLSRGGNSGTQLAHNCKHWAVQIKETENYANQASQSSENSPGLQIPLMVARNFINPPAQCSGSAMVNSDRMRLSYLSSSSDLINTPNVRYKARPGITAGWWTWDASLQIVSIRLTLSCSCHTLHSRKARTLQHLNRVQRRFTTLFAALPIPPSFSQGIHVRFYCLRTNSLVERSLRFISPSGGIVTWII